MLHSVIEQRFPDLLMSRHPTHLSLEYPKSAGSVFVLKSQVLVVRNLGTTTRASVSGQRRRVCAQCDTVAESRRRRGFPAKKHVCGPCRGVAAPDGCGAGWVAQWSGGVREWRRYLAGMV